MNCLEELVKTHVLFKHYKHKLVAIKMVHSFYDGQTNHV